MRRLPPNTKVQGGYQPEPTGKPRPPLPSIGSGVKTPSEILGRRPTREDVWLTMYRTAVLRDQREPDKHANAAVAAFAAAFPESK